MTIKKKLNFNNITVGHLCLILALIIILIPLILTQSSLWSFADFSDKGPIGDTIGGITSPFINAIAAILVFIAFKEQVKANNLLKEQQYFQHIQEQIHRLEDDYLDLPNVIIEINKDIRNSISMYEDWIGQENTPPTITIDESLLNKALYSTALFEQAINLIETMNHNKEFMENKIKLLYKIIYRDNYLKLHKMLYETLKYEKNTSKLYITEILLQIQRLQDKLDDTMPVTNTV